jgi:hypothetical protein
MSLACPEGTGQLCRKVRHSTEEQALNALARTWRDAWKTEGGRKLPIRVYCCTTCGGFHLTSRPVDE